MKKDNKHINGFSIPEQYLENLEDKLLERISEEKNQTSILNNKLDHGFNIPENYLDDLEHIIVQKVYSKKGKIITLFTKQNLLYISGIAAILAIIITFSIQEKPNLNFDQISALDIQEYINEGYIELSDTDIAELLPEYINFIDTDTEQQINDETIIDYLSNEDIENELTKLD